MDYDDKNFRNHNFHLSIEDNKFPHNLPSYALSKFDIEDHLPLRFDNLVETEALLGIQSQGHNHWIEDYSRASSGIEFSSSATESCSISMRNNVWSEATSSESVEMLLKSVGDDEMITKQNHSENSDVCKELVNLDNQMVLHLNQNDSLPPRVEDVMAGDCSLLTNQGIKCSYVSCEDRAQDIHEVNNVPHMEQDEHSGFDEMITKQICDENSEVCKELDNLENQMDHCLNEDDSLPCRIEEAIARGCSLLTDQQLKCSFVSREDEAGDIHEANHMPQIEEDENSGSDDVRAKQSFNENSNVCKELDNLEDQMDLSVNQECSLPSRVEDAIARDCSVPTNQSPKSSSVSLEDGGKDMHEVKNMQQIEQDENSGFENFSDLDSISASEKYGSYSNITTEHCGPEKNLSLLSDEQTTQDNPSSPASGLIGNSSDNKSVEHMEGDHFSVSSMHSVVANRVLNDVRSPKEGKDGFTEVSILNIQPMKDNSQKMKLEVLSVDAISEGCEKDSVLKYANEARISNFSVDTTSSLQETGHVKDVESPKLDDTCKKKTGVLRYDMDFSNELKGNKSSIVMERKHHTHHELAASGNSDACISSSFSEVNAANSMIHDSNDVLKVSDSYGSPRTHPGQDSRFDVSGKDKADEENEIGNSVPDFSLTESAIVVPENSKSLHNSRLANHAEVPISSLDEKLSQSYDSNTLEGTFNDTYVKKDVSVFDRENIRVSSSTPRNETEMNGSIEGKIIETPSHGEGSPLATANKLRLDCTRLAGDASVPSTEVVGAASEPASASKVEQNNQVINGVVEQRVVKSPETLMDSQEAEISKEPSTFVAKVGCISLASDESIDGQQLVCSSSAELQAEMVAIQPSSPVDESLQSVSQTETPTLAVHLNEGLKRDSVTQMPALDGCEALKFSSDGAAFDIPGVAMNGEMAVKPLASSAKNDESHSVEAESGNQISNEENCGSPVIISCGECSESKKDYQEGDNSVGSQENISISSDCARILSNSQIQTHANNVQSTSEEDKSFTFVVGAPADASERENGKGWGPLLLQATEGLTSPSLSDAPQIRQGASSENHQACYGENMQLDTKTILESKVKSSSGNAAGKKTSIREKTNKRSSHQKKLEKENNAFNASTNLLETSKSMSVELKQYSCNEDGGFKPSCIPAILTSNLPDLNSSAVTISHQPFTDLQQVQLRAQIFVYGSLIQCTPPDESCMMSAFGDNSKGGRSLWENAWQLAVKKFQSQKSPLSNFETPVQSRLGAWASEISRITPFQNKAHSSLVGRLSNNCVSSSSVSSFMSLSSPVWNVSTTRDPLKPTAVSRGPFLDSHQLVAPLHPYQSPQTRKYVGNSASWLSSSPCPPWVASCTSPVTETVQVKPAHVSSVAEVSNLSIAMSSPSVTCGGSISVTPGVPLSVEVNSLKASPVKQASADQKPRKRKKRLEPMELVLVSAGTPQVDSSSNGVANKLISGVPSTDNTKLWASASISASSPIASSTHYQVVGGSDTNRKVIFSDETCSRIEQAKLHAEDAAALAASSIQHCQGIWNQLSVQKNSGLISEVEVKLASAAVAAAAAVSVAKAAASAAKVASDAALQAKLMADEALEMSNMVHSFQASEPGVVDDDRNLEMMDPVSLLKGNPKTNNPNLIIRAAREAARKRVETASAAAKRAENLDAIVKAAELAAEAVSHAGTIIAMGEPMPLTLCELTKAGPDGYWRNQHMSSKQVEPNERCDDHTALDDSIQALDDRPVGCVNVQSSKDNGTSISLDEVKVADNLSERILDKVDGTQYDSATSEKGYDRVSRTGLDDESEEFQQLEMSKDNTIVENANVEVASDKNGHQGVWFSAKVLSVRDGKAHVCFDKGSEKLKEWITLESQGNEAPRIRNAHPVTAMKYQGTRKRRRVAMESYVWSVGDRVDALIHDGWWEGVVTEKDKKDETKLTVQLSAGGESSIIRSWNLRPSLIWRNGQWIEWSRENSSSQLESDTPKDKRQKLGINDTAVRATDTHIVAGEEDKMSRNPCNEYLKRPAESMSLSLSDKERMFSIGKVVSEKTNICSAKIKRTGLQKEGSRVFGVPKPGKKRKFMEVSKHYVANQAPKVSDGSDAINFTKYLIPHGSRGVKTMPKVNDKEKVLKAGKTHVIQAKMTESPMVSSSLGLTSDARASQRKTNGSELAVKGKRNPSSERLVRDEEKCYHGNIGSRNLDPAEPRRSNRRIQPTSRLLEGLQSSMSIAKIPPVSHVKVQNKSGVSSRGGHSRG